MVREQWAEIAKTLGLSQYEAGAYLALIEFGEATAGEISKASRVPRGRVYGTLEALHAKGLVSITSTSPQRYRPAPIAVFLDEKRRELREKEEELSRTAGVLAKIPLRRRAASIATGDFLMYRKRGAVMAKIRTMLEGATQEIVVVASEGWALRSSKLLLPGLREKSAKGVDIRSCVNITPKNMGAVQALSQHIKVRHSTLGNQVVTITVVDKAQVLVCHWNPDDDSPFFGDDVGVWSDDPGVVSAFYAIAQETWEGGVEDRVRLRELETGEPPGTTHFYTDLERLQKALLAGVREATRIVRVSGPNSLLVEQPENILTFFSALPLGTLEVRFLLFHDSGSMDTAESLARLGVKVRISDAPTLGRHVIVDERHAMSFLFPGSEWTTAGSAAGKRRLQDILVSTTIQSAVAALVAAHDFEWERATPLEARPEVEASEVPPLVREGNLVE